MTVNIPKIIYKINVTNWSISEFEKLSCLHIRGGEMKTLHWLNMNYSRSFRLVSKVVLIVHTDWCLHSPSRTVRARGSPAGDWNPSGLTQTLGPSCRETDVLMWGCEESLLLSSLLTTSRAESVEFTENVRKEWLWKLPSCWHTGRDKGGKL